MSTTAPWKLGLFVVVGAVLALAAALYVGTASLRRDHVSYTTYFDEAVHGLNVGGVIEVRGVVVGQVSGIAIAPDRRHVEVTCALYESALPSLGLAKRTDGEPVEVPPELRVQLASQGITGIKVLQLDFFDVASHPPPELGFSPPARYIPSTASTLKTLEDSVTGAMARFPDVAEAVLAVTSHAERMLRGFDDLRLPQQVVATLREVETTLAAMRAAVGQAQVGKLSAQAQHALAGFDALAARGIAVMGKLDGERGMLASVQRTTDAVGDLAVEGRPIAAALEATLRDMQEATASFQRLTDALERDPDMLLKGRGGGE